VWHDFLILFVHTDLCQYVWIYVYFNEREFYIPVMYQNYSAGAGLKCDMFATDIFTVTLIVSLSLMYLWPSQLNVSEIFIYSKTVLISSISKL
jgi:hypothetical protein